MKKIIVFGLILFFAGRAVGQKESFDIARFVSPAGWQRIDSNGMVMFANSKTVNNRISFCQIFLCPSKASSLSPMENFDREWKDHVIRLQGNHDDPKPQADKPDKGWTPVTGHVNITAGEQEKITYTCFLVVASGHGRVMSVIINMAGADFVNDAQQFLAKMDLDPHGVGAGSSVSGRAGEESGGTGSVESGPGGSGSGPATLADYIYEVPPGWVSTNYPDGIVLSSPPPSSATEPCNITLLPIRAASNDIAGDANRIFATVFSTFVGHHEYTQNSMVRGISPQGWEYFIIKRGIVRPGGNYQAFFGFVCVIKLGDRLAAMSGMSKDPLVSSCFGLNLRDVWPHFFYSLRFRNWNGRSSEAGLMKRMAGVWIMATATAGDRWVFAPNGRYASAAAAQRYAATSSEVLAITDAYFGNGSWSLKGWNIFFTGDNNKSDTKKGWYRLEEESKDEGNTWVSKLYILRISDVNGEEYEVGYHRN
jgi:hypothetical protein